MLDIRNIITWEYRPYRDHRLQSKNFMNKCEITLLIIAYERLTPALPKHLIVETDLVIEKRDTS